MTVEELITFLRRCPQDALISLQIMKGPSYYTARLEDVEGWRVDGVSSMTFRGTCRDE